MADGKGCKCAARSESECGCDADWTPQEVYNLRTENEQLKEAIRRLAEEDATLSVCDGNVTVTMDATLTDVEQSLIRRLAAECEGGHPREWTNRALTADDRATLRGLLERTK